jgi:very-short-patch-repair endonuclease
MPEIIQFSNNLCYSSEPLEPLRQYGAARLEPVVTTHVVEGYQKGHSQRIINPPEAEAVAQRIKACIQEPAYKGKSMGVISLLGNNQAKHIERLLLESIGPEVMEKRNLVCGDAYAFQGDERDVMFLSLVSAPTEGHRIGTLADQKAERRFNVAASRAKDQLWLFHTATLQNDLSPRCLRYRLLEYCLNPQLRPVELEGVNIGELRKLARTVQRTRINHPPPFDSWFEVDVFFEIIDRGYRVIPQSQLGGYYIDLLVQGIEGRLGVECDGDAWHGPEQYGADVARERKLWRCGLQFCRIRESSFYWDRDAALKDLWETLDSLKIYATTRSGGASRTGGEDSDSAGSARVATESPTPAVTAPADEDGAEARRTKVQGRQTSLSGFLQEQSRIAFSAADKQPSKRQDEGSTAAENGSLTSPDSSHGEPDNTTGDDLAGDVLPYCHWVKRPLRDPRIATIDETLEGLLEIIRAEGPMPCHGAYRLFAGAAEMKRVGRQIRSFLNRAIAKGVRKGLIEQRNEYGSRDQINKIVFIAGGEAVVLRTRGGRQFGEIPPSEVGLLMKKKLKASDSLSDEDLFRSVLEFYGAKNMTVQILKRLKWIKQNFLGA